MNTTKLVLAILFSIAIASCGGGGGPSTLGGTAATGAAIANATVTIKGANGVTVSATTDATGKYPAKDVSSLTAPYLLKVTTAAGAELYSVATATGTANIHPFTDLIIRNWYKTQSSNVETDFGGTSALAKPPTAAEIDAIESAIRSTLSVHLANEGLTTANFNLLTSTFDANHSGFDGVLDNTKVTISANGVVTVTATDPITGVTGTMVSTSLSTNLAVADTTKPSDQTGVTATPSSANSIDLVWQESTDNLGVAGYNIYRGGIKIGTSPYPTYRDAGLLSSSYCYQVEAFDGAGNGSSRSPQTCAAPAIPPVATTGLTATADSGLVTISWAAASGATAYNIYWGTSAGITAAAAKITGATSPYAHTGISTGKTYCYRVGAENVGGETLSDEVCTFAYSGSFGVTGNVMSAARMYHAATLLPDGKVLVTGGFNAAGGYLSSAELYNPASGLFEATGSMTTARARHTATLLPNGKVLIAGGYAGAAALASAELYDPATGVFSNAHGMMGSLATARCQHTATLLPNGMVLLAGGYGTDYLASAELFNPATNIFSSAGSMISAGKERTATLLPNGKVLVTGGRNGTASTSFIASAEIYDPATNLFSATTNGMGAARAAHTATRLPNGKILIVGGATIGTTYLSNAELYDPATGLFAAAPGSMNMARGYHAATLLPNGKVLLTGGINGTGYLASTELYDPVLDSFSLTGDMATARDLHVATLLLDGTVLVTAGWGGSYLSSAELFQ